MAGQDNMRHIYLLLLTSTAWYKFVTEAELKFNSFQKVQFQAVTGFKKKKKSKEHFSRRWFLAPFSEMLYVIMDMFVFICHCGLLLRKCSISCLFPAIKATSLKLIVFDFQRIFYQGNTKKLLLIIIFTAVKTPNGCSVPFKKSTAWICWKHLRILFVTCQITWAVRNQNVNHTPSDFRTCCSNECLP